MNNRIAVRALALLLAAVAIDAQATEAAPRTTATEAGATEKTASCILVSGSIAAVTRSEGETTLVQGNVTGTLAGSLVGRIGPTSAHADGALRAAVVDHLVMLDGAQLTTEDEVILTPVPRSPGVFHQRTTFNVVGGSGRFANASGTFMSHGEADTTRGTVVSIYEGRICGVAQ